MLRRTFFLGLFATLLMLGTSTNVQAWGAYHAGYTHVGPSGVQHYGYTTAHGPYGGYSGSHYGSYNNYGGGYHSSSYNRYGTGGYGGGYSYHYGTSSGSYVAPAGVYRRW